MQSIIISKALACEFTSDQMTGIVSSMIANEHEVRMTDTSQLHRMNLLQFLLSSISNWITAWIVSKDVPIPSDDIV